MKKLLTNKKFTQKILIAIVIVLLFNFIVPTTSKAWGGILMKPILELVIRIGDTILSLLQNYLYDGGGHDGIANSLLGAAYFQITQNIGLYPEMEFEPKYDENGNEKNVITISATNFMGISASDLALGIINLPLEGGRLLLKRSHRFIL